MKKEQQRVLHALNQLEHSVTKKGGTRVLGGSRLNKVEMSILIDRGKAEVGEGTLC
jgi:hypothetical protein